MNASADLSSEYLYHSSQVMIADEMLQFILDYVAYGNDISHSKYPSDLLFSISDDEMDRITDSLLWDIPAPNFNPAHDIVGRNYDTIRRPRHHPLPAPPPKPFKRKRR
jgi:hypothetical protein